MLTTAFGNGAALERLEIDNYHSQCKCSHYSYNLHNHKLIGSCVCKDGAADLWSVRFALILCIIGS